MRLQHQKAAVGFLFAASLLVGGCAVPSTDAAGGAIEEAPEEAGEAGRVAEGPSPSGEPSEEEAACLNFYRSVDESTEEEVHYFRRFAQRIEGLGHADAAAVLWDLADQWETGIWETQPGEEAPELAISAKLALAGASLAREGHIRCADLSEVWRIDGYRGEPSPEELATRQRAIWIANGIDDYRLLVAQVVEDGGTPRQYHVQVVDRRAERVLDAETGKQVEAGSLDLPLTVEAIYQQMNQGGPLATSYDLVHSVPISVGSLYVEFDLHEFPEPLEPGFEEA